MTIRCICTCQTRKNKLEYWLIAYNVQSCRLCHTLGTNIMYVNYISILKNNKIIIRVWAFQPAKIICASAMT